LALDKHCATRNITTTIMGIDENSTLTGQPQQPSVEYAPAYTAAPQYQQVPQGSYAQPYPTTYAVVAVDPTYDNHLIGSIIVLIAGFFCCCIWPLGILYVVGKVSHSDPSHRA
jgi:hypothetical protein